MKQFIRWTGASSLLAGVTLQWPVAASLLMPSEQIGLQTRLFGIVAVFLGVMLIVCSRDLRNRGALVAWEGLLRIAGFAVMTWYGVLGNAGTIVACAGVLDLLIGLTYLVCLPIHLKTTLIALLRDRIAETSGHSCGLPTDK